jgi:hypothetical protein
VSRRTIGSISATRFGVKAFETSARTRVCCGGSMEIITGSGLSVFSSVGPCVEVKLFQSSVAFQQSSKRESAQKPSRSLW